MNRRAAELASPADFPDEPPTPDRIDAERFASALRELCGWMPPDRPAEYTGYILEAAEAFDEDPFLLAALGFRMGRCRADASGLGDGLGITLIDSRMHWDFLRHGQYTYWVRDAEGAWVERTLAMDRYPFNEIQLRRAQANFYFAAGILRVLREQMPDLRAAFEQEPYRHPVSHFIWGDRVLSSRGEDRVLLDRRRLLAYYGATTNPFAILRAHGLDWVSPLDGGRRVISSFIGADRDGGSRFHRGVDVESVLGEPVRAVAAGRVNFAGVDLPGSRNSENLGPREINAYDRDAMGNGGRYVCVLHRPDDAPWLRTCYMHLDTVEVRQGQDVQAGELLGTVGRTGMRESSPHLHFELHGPDGLMDAHILLAPFFIAHRPTDAPRPRSRRRQADRLALEAEDRSARFPITDAEAEAQAASASAEASAVTADMPDSADTEQGG